MATLKPLLESRNLTTVLGGRSGFLRKSTPTVRAVDDVSLSIAEGETYGVVGESGCGKTTLGRTLLGLIRETSGEIVLEGRKVDALAPKAAREARRAIQYLHQDAASALDPWWSIGRTLEEAAEVAGVKRSKRRETAKERLRAVGLDPDASRSYPHQLSGGQLRRVALARILIMSPKLVILDEPTAGLDLSIQATILNLLIAIKRSFNLTNLFISHDMSVVRLVCDRVAVMYRGRIVEEASAVQLFREPRHPYTRVLLAATPRLAAPCGDAVRAIEATDGLESANGCAFYSRCEHAHDLCRAQAPQLESVDDLGSVACHRWREIGSSGSKT